MKTNIIFNKMKKNLFLLIASLFLCGSIFGQEHYFICNADDYSGNMSFYAAVTIDGTYVNSTNYEVGAFVGDECRMSAFFDYEILPSSPVIWSAVNFTNTGEEVTFKLYDHNTGRTYEQCSFTAVTSEDGYTGINGDYTGYNISGIEDLVVLPFTTPTHTLVIDGYGNTEEASNYYLVSSPIGEVDPTAVTNMIPSDNNFDLFYFDQAQDLEWINYKHSSFNLEVGKGYLYANKAGEDLIFTGFPYEEAVTVTLFKNKGNNEVGFEGWNLIGNPYGVAATIDRSYYVMNEGGTELLATMQSGDIPAMNGVFVLATSDGEQMDITPGSSKASSNMVSVDLCNENSQVIDRAIVRFGNGDLLPKFQINENSTKIYIPQNNVDYAILNANNEGQMPVNFKPAKNGNYSLIVTPENLEMEYLHLIDNLTGADVDLLANPKYNFSGNTEDYAARFTLRFRANNSVDINETFCPMTYRQDGTLAINGIQGESELMLIDMLGRVVSKESFNIIDGVVRNINTTPGVYVVRLINNNNIYTQKIVVE